ncbi:hypothetical protein NHG35_03585 [Aerococcaceae bacterium NML180378]|nr:hypothetical protein [Aerococcaceae bacterium NML180378]MDO4775203.1 hypothetical protein [Aerococcaceae bacterium]
MKKIWKQCLILFLVLFVVISIFYGIIDGALFTRPLETLGFSLIGTAVFAFRYGIR